MIHTLTFDILIKIDFQSLFSYRVEFEKISPICFSKFDNFK